MEMDFKSYKYVINVNSPLTVSMSNIEGHPHIPASSIRGAMRAYFNDLSYTNEPIKSLQVPLFGDLDNRGSIIITDAINNEINVVRKTFIDYSRENSVYDSELLGVGTRLRGELRISENKNSAIVIGAISSLIGVSSLGAKRNLGYGAVEVCVDANDIEQNKIYDSMELENFNEGIENLIKNVLPLIQKTVIKYYYHTHEEILSVSPRMFEKVVCEVFYRGGFDVELTPETRDGGFDILAIRHKNITNNEIVLVECKRYSDKRKVGISVVRNLVGVLQIENATRGVIVTTSSFSKPAEQLAKKVGLTLYDLTKLKLWIEELHRHPKW